MPKDPARNQPNYKIGGHHMNEYEFENAKGEITEEAENRPRNEREMKGRDSKDREMEGPSNSNPK